MEDQALPRLTIKEIDQEERLMMKKPASHSKFVLCVRSGTSEDLEVRKVYQARPDRKAASEGYLRIIDESGEDYLYPSEFFVPVRLPAATMRAFGERVAAR
jgi:hypothetical protein